MVLIGKSNTNIGQTRYTAGRAGWPTWLKSRPELETVNRRSKIIVLQLPVN